MKPIVEVKGLWKQYRRGAQQERYLSFRESIVKKLQPTGKKEKFWALQDINFDVSPGDSLAIIGRNGAGKSTLLKILSRITPPTKGEIILRGRLASLLEVGTGFHAELTGRENIYLNGSILGLKRSEINMQFDAIVDFSGIESFLDTPLKHYSSGMQLRLAFAVAAHLEPEILVIDEVLAVGDSAFQQKCIDKMTEVSNNGRTLIFVSHNLNSIQKLCDKAILIENGTIQGNGKVEEIINQYRGSKIQLKEQLILEGYDNRQGAGELIFRKLMLNSEGLNFGQDIEISFQLSSKSSKIFRDLDLGIAIITRGGQTIIHMSNRFSGNLIDHEDDSVIYKFICTNHLKPGNYDLSLFVRAEDVIQDWIRDSVEFNIGQGNPYNFHDTSQISGVILPEFTFITLMNGKK